MKSNVKLTVDMLKSDGGMLHKEYFCEGAIIGVVKDIGDKDSYGALAGDVSPHEFIDFITNMIINYSMNEGYNLTDIVGDIMGMIKNELTVRALKEMNGEQLKELIENKEFAKQFFGEDLEVKGTSGDLSQLSEADRKKFVGILNKYGGEEVEGADCVCELPFHELNEEERMFVMKCMQATATDSVTDEIISRIMDDDDEPKH